MLNSKYKTVILWLDDNLPIIRTGEEKLRIFFENKYNNSPSVLRCTNYAEFQKIYEQKKEIIDFIFLDINLGQNSPNGIDIYKEIRKTNKDISIVFVSANLNYDDVDVEDLKDNDKNLSSLTIPFPTKRRKEEYRNELEIPVENIIEKENNRLYKKTILDLKNQSQEGLQKYYEKALYLNTPIIEESLAANKDLKSIIITGEERKNTMLFTNRPVNLDFALNLLESNEKTTFAYNIKSNGSYTVEDISPLLIKRFKSTETIPAEILKIEDNHVLLNCLLDEKERQFQLRKYDLEPIKGAVKLEKNNIIIITINTYQGERVFTFKDGPPDFRQKFERKKYFDGDKDRSAFLKHRS